MSWLIIAIFAYLLGGVVFLVDKYLLKRSIPNPVVYTFYVGLLGLAALVLAPFGFRVPTFSHLIISFVAGFIFISALLFFYFALKKEEASRIVPFVGGLTPFFIFILAWVFLGETLSSNQILAFFIILGGTFLISLELEKEGQIFTSQAFFLALPAALFFASTHTLSKFIYLQENFISGFLWIRIGAALGALILFLIPRNKKAIIEDLKRPKIGRFKIFLFGQGCGALSFILVNYAFSLGPVSLVNALAGIQYVFLFALIVFLSLMFPKIFQEKFTPKIIFQKVISIALITLGVAILFF
jgi:transporter family protein